MATGGFRLLPLLLPSQNVPVLAVLAGTAPSGLEALSGADLWLVVGCFRVLRPFAASQADAGASVLLDGIEASVFFLFDTGRAAPLGKVCLFPCVFLGTGMAAVGPLGFSVLEEADVFIRVLRLGAALGRPTGMPLG